MCCYMVILCYMFVITNLYFSTSVYIIFVWYMYVKQHVLNTVGDSSLWQRSHCVLRCFHGRLGWVENLQSHLLKESPFPHVISVGLKLKSRALSRSDSYLLTYLGILLDRPRWEGWISVMSIVRDVPMDRLSRHETIARVIPPLLLHPATRPRHRRR